MLAYLCTVILLVLNPSASFKLTITPDRAAKLPDDEVIFNCQSDDETIKPQFRLNLEGPQFYPPRMQVIHLNNMSTSLRLHSLSERQDQLQIICFHGTTEHTALLNVLRTCNDTQMSCGSSKECFLPEKACDGKPDCTGSHDERKVMCPGVRIEGNVSLAGKLVTFVDQLLDITSDRHLKLVSDLCSQVDTVLRLQKSMSGVSNICHMKELHSATSLAVIELHMNRSTLDDFGVSYKSHQFYERIPATFKVLKDDQTKYMFRDAFVIHGKLKQETFPVGVGLAHQPSHLVFLALVIFVKIPLF
ncbi:hypothetical protein EG68_04547 [Paragonimus skrjabini miyazakii]|uniref:Hemoglobin linker chain n=1 Tax=Paragonimus skrjabini miyazakii TaxID=59628 RepID=A0A8S9YT10_9TREM|nr:hypothetical protein EG68_04547 [Paragonimus skrjabini miyazakii]